MGGTVYGVVLNDRNERVSLAYRFNEKPYSAPPAAPVVYVKPRQCLTDGPIDGPADGGELVIAASVTLLFGRDACKIPANEALTTVAAVALAIDAFLPHPDYYRPPIAARVRDRSLVLGGFAPTMIPSSIETSIDGAVVHRWTADRFLRTAGRLVADLSDFMTLRAGDMLLMGTPGDAPLARQGQAITVRAEGMPTIRTMIGNRL